MIFLPRDPAIAVSVIVPIYDTGRYLSRCLDSVLGQTLQNIEVVAVDDASTDDSAEILRRYADQDRRLTVVRHERNQGLHLARISGVLAAAGQYIGYVDSDDHVVPDMFERLFRRAVDDQADVVRTGAWLRREDESPWIGTPTTLSFEGRTYATGIEHLDADFYPAMWLHLHHWHLWPLALPHFPRTRLIGEDNLTSFVLAFFAGRVVSLPGLGYVYVERDDSLTGNRSFASAVRNIEDRGTIVQLLKAFVDSNGGRAVSGWNVLKGNNRDLVFAYIGSLADRAERMIAADLYESAWCEVVPNDVRASWARDTARA